MGAAGSALGLYLNIHFDLPGAGASIAATLAAIFLLSVLLRSIFAK
jgi:ABC-type Mn2+/Zn2+ transport system permease subunit